MGFFRNQEIKLAMRLLKWKYENANSPLPDEPTLKQTAVRIVDDAHHIAKQRGNNVLAIIKDLVSDIQKK